MVQLPLPVHLQRRVSVSLTFLGPLGPNYCGASSRLVTPIFTMLLGITQSDAPGYDFSWSVGTSGRDFFSECNSALGLVVLGAWLEIKCCSSCRYSSLAAASFSVYICEKRCTIEDSATISLLYYLSKQFHTKWWSGYLLQSTFSLWFQYLFHLRLFWHKFSY